MWIYTKKGFFSIVQDKDDEDYLIVRARVKGDIEHYFQDVDVQEDVGSDYRYRIRVLRHTAANNLGYMAMSDIDYTNYKAAVNMADHRRSQYYGLIWSIMADMQDEFQNAEKNPRSE